MTSVFWTELALLLPACLYAGWSDTFQRRISNWLCLLTAAAGFAVAAVTAGVPEMGSHALHAAVALVTGMVLFRFGMIGGGDAKFYTACAAWFAWGDAPRLLLAVSLAGLVLFLGWFTIRRIMRKPIRARSESHFDKLPYGIAIAAGAVVTAFA
jgi:prepilin peptidase CpaA